MPDRRGRKGRIDDLIPEDRISCAREVWADRVACARTSTGIWMLREAGKILGLPEEAVDDVVKGRGAHGEQHSEAEVIAATGCADGGFA